MLFFLNLFILLFIHSNNAARILAVFPAPSISHQIVFRPITQELAKRGHEVLVITPDPAFPDGNAPANLTEIDVHEISYNVWREGVKKISKGNVDFITIMTYMLDVFLNVQEAYFKSDKIQNLLNDKSKQFDLLLIEGMGRPSLIFSHFYKVPVIQINSFGSIWGNYEAMGAPTHPMLFPVLTRRKINNLTMWEKITEIYQQLSLDLLLYRRQELENAMYRKYLGDSAPKITDLMDNVDMLFLSVNPIFEGIRPVPPSVQYIGGVHLKPEKELPTDLKTYLDSSKNGVIYMSFGTNVMPSLLPPETIQTFIKVFADLPYNVLWKYDKDELPGKTDNIKIGKWFPQSDILRHPNIKLFVGQGGLQSTEEALAGGVPLLAFPLLSDQWFNAEKYEYHKIGIQLDMATFTYDDLKNAIKTVIGDESYSRNVVHLHKLMNDEPMKPLERAVWWTEYVLRHGGAKQLRSPTANITWWRYLELDLVFTLLLFVTVLLTVVFFLLKRILRAFMPAKSGLKKKKN